MFFYFSKVLFSGFLQFNGYFVDGQNNSKILWVCSSKSVTLFVHSWQRHPIGDRSLSAVNLFLDSMAKEARNILSQMCPDYIQLNQQVSNQHLSSCFSVHGNTYTYMYSM